MGDEAREVAAEMMAVFTRRGMIDPPASRDDHTAVTLMITFLGFALNSTARPRDRKAALRTVLRYLGRPLPAPELRLVTAEAWLAELTKEKRTIPTI